MAGTRVLAVHRARSTVPRVANLATVLVKKEASDGLESFWLPLNNQ